MQSKGYFRNKVRQEVISCGKQELSERSDKVVSMLNTIPEVQNAETLMLYHPLFDEVDLLGFAKEALNSGKRIGFPVCVHQSRNIIVREVRSLEEDFHTTNVYNLMEPNDSCPVIQQKNVDCVIVPGRAFDRLGNRVGRGKGYYDNFLKSTHFHKIAAGYSFQVFEHVPTDSHDIPLDFIVTEETVITCTIGA